MGHHAVNRPWGRRCCVCVAGFLTLLARQLGAQPAPSATFPVEPAPAASQAPSPATTAPPAVVYATPEAYAQPVTPTQVPTDPRAAPASASRTPSPNAVPAATPRDADEHPSPDVGWSLGAGVAFVDSLGGVSSGPTGFFGLNPSSAVVPSYRLSIERRLGRNTWLALNGAFSYTHTDQPITFTSQSTPQTRNTLELESAQEALLLGVRQVVARGIVDVSLYLAIAGAHSKTRGDMPVPGENVAIIPGGRGNAFGAVAGISVERELIDSLALRLTADIVSVSVTKQSEERIDLVTRELTTSERTSQGAGLTLRPGIQLQFYF